MAKRTEKMNFGQYDQMPTEALNTLLSLDLDADSGVELEPDAVLYILEVIRTREEADAAAEKVDVEAAWEKFNNEYRPAAESIVERYAEETPNDEANEIVEAMPSRKARRRHFGIRGWVTAAAVVVVIVIGMVPSRATGVTLWSTIVQWMNNTFGLENDIEYPDLLVEENPCQNLQRRLRERGITAKIVPTWLPGDLQQQSIEEQEKLKCSTFKAIYQDSQRQIAIQLSCYTDDMGPFHKYEKDSSKEYQCYVSNGIQHYFSQNNDEEFLILWRVDNIECFISGDFTETEAEQIVDSIYQ